MRAKDAEILLLGHQVAVLRRTEDLRTRFMAGDVLLVTT
jgi:hypothetical protein